MRGIYLVEVIQMKEIRSINRSIGGIYTKGDYERLVSQNELLKDKVISFDFGIITINFCSSFCIFVCIVGSCLDI